MTEENEKKKEYLRGYERAVRQMERSELRIKEIRLNKMCPSVIADGMPHTSGGGDLSGYAAMLDREEKRYMKARYQKTILGKEIVNKIRKIRNSDEVKILKYRYIRLWSWNKIAKKLGKSTRQILRIHGKALEDFSI